MIDFVLPYFLLKKQYPNKINKTPKKQPMGCFFGVLLILLGYYFFNRKYGNTKSIIIKYFEGKIKSRQLFLSDDNKEIMDVKREIENRIINK